MAFDPISQRYYSPEAMTTPELADNNSIENMGQRNLNQYDDSAEIVEGNESIGKQDLSKSVEQTDDQQDPTQNMPVSQKAK